MKNQLLAVLITIMLTSSSCPVVFVRSTPIKDASKTSEKHIDLTFTLPEVVKAGNYDWLKISDCSYISTPGHPMLPIRSVAEKLPLNSHVTQITAKVENVSLKEDYSIMPALTPVQADFAEPLNMAEPDPTIYGKDELYPQEWYTYRIGNGLDPDTNRRVQYTTIYLYPLRYLPTQKKILLAQHVSLTITYTEPAEEPTAQTVLKNLIITSDTLEPYAVQLAAYKNSTGISSRAVNLTWVYKNYGGIDRPEQIRNCIKGFVAAYGITYVTIFGDADQVPVRYAFVNDTQTGETYVPTDLYYGDLDRTWDDNNDGIYADQRYDNVDGIPDVFLGRISVSTTEYANYAVAKIMNYTSQDMTSNWTKRVILSAGTGDAGPGGSQLGSAPTALNDYISNIVTDRTNVKLYNSQGNLTTALLISESSKGAAFLNFAGHGDPGVGVGSAGWLLCWTFDYLIFEGFREGDIQLLTNGAKLPVVTTMSCSTARFDDVDCVGESWTCIPDKGGIAYFGATRIAWCYVDQWVTTGLMGEIDWRIYQAFYEGYTKLGQMWGIPVTRYVQSHILNYKYASVYDVKTLMEFVLLGDPTLRIYNPEHPETLNVPEDCPTIQSAINAAYDGDTVNVSSGIYYENVVVNKSLSLIGQERDSTIIDGNSIGNALNITACNVNVNGFTIRRSGTVWPGEHGIYISGTSSGNNVSGNIITGNGYGISLESSSNNTISGNNITNNNNGIDLYSSSYDSVSGNNITASNYGYGIYLGSSSNNSVSGNNIADSWYGIDLYSSSNNTIYHNNFVNNMSQVVSSGSTNVWDDGYPSGGNYRSDYAGVDLFSGPYQNETGSDVIVDTPYVIDANNTDHYPLMQPWVSYENGTIYIRGDGTVDPSGAPILRKGDLYTLTGNITSDADGIVIERDNITLNGAGYTLQCVGGDSKGINLTGRSNVTIKNMKITAFQYGIYLDSSNNSSVSGNNIKANNGYGIVIGSSSGNSISGNNITNNGYGIYLDSSINNSVSGNNITNNGMGVELGSSSSHDSISGNNMTNNRYGIALVDSSGNSISGNDITATFGYGILLNSYPSYLNSSDNNSISGNNITTNNWNGHGIELNDGSGNSISGNDITANNGNGIKLDGSSNNSISGNDITANWAGIQIGTVVSERASNYNSISENNITANGYDGISIYSSSGNSIFHNNFINNTQQVYSSNSVNVWDDGYPSGGNYWSDCSGTDLYHGPYQNETGSDGIGDAPYTIDANNLDNYPLMNLYNTNLLSITISPSSATLDVGQSQTFSSTVSGGTLPYTYQWCSNGTAVPDANFSSWTFTPTSADSYTIYVNVTDSVGVQTTSNTATVTVNIGTHDVAVTNVASSKTVVCQGFNCCDIDVTVANQGGYPETFNVTAYANYTATGNTTCIVTFVNVTLAIGTSTNLTFDWNTTGFAKGNYTLSAYTEPVQGETDIANNTFTGGWVKVTIVGDVNGDGKVNIIDTFSVALAYGSYPGHPMWNPNYDINNDGKINLIDYFITALNYGKTDP